MGSLSHKAQTCSLKLIQPLSDAELCQKHAAVGHLCHLNAHFTAFQDWKAWGLSGLMTRDAEPHLKDPTLIWLMAGWSRSFTHPRLPTVRWLTGQYLPLILGLSYWWQCPGCLIFLLDTSWGQFTPPEQAFKWGRFLLRKSALVITGQIPREFGLVHSDAPWLTHPRICQVHLEFSKTNGES